MEVKSNSPNTRYRASKKSNVGLARSFPSGRSIGLASKCLTHGIREPQPPEREYMNDMKHTPEPWEIHEAPHHVRGEYWATIGHNGRGPITDIVGEEGNHAKYYIPVAGMKYLVTPVEQQRANARRIVACVNACVDLSTEYLEVHGRINAIGHAYATIEAERDTLLARVERLRECLEKLLLWTLHGDNDASICGACGNHGKTHHPECPTMEARAALSEKGDVS